MTLRIPAIIAGAACTMALTGCARTYDVTIPTHVAAQLDLSAFRRILIAGFVTPDPREDLDLNVETTRLLRSQFRSKTSLYVIDSADIVSLIQMASFSHVLMDGPSVHGVVQSPHRSPTHDRVVGPETLFANRTFWKRLGEEYVNPLILTGTLRFAPKGSRYRLTTSFILIDGRTGGVLHSDTYYQEVVHRRTQRVSTLSCYFELMDRIVPAVLTTVTDQTVQVPRVLLK